MINSAIKRGQIYLADLDPVLGSEQGGCRPVVVIQNNIGNQYSPTVIVAAITSRPKSKLPTHVSLGNFRGLDKESVILSEQLRTIDKQRLEGFVGHLFESHVQELDRALQISIGVKNRSKPMFLCLCPTCASQFYYSELYHIRRADRGQIVKDTCMFCNVRKGYDYIVSKK